jgi:hypothetical protein
LWGGRRHRSRTGHWGGQKTIFARGSDRRSKLPWHSSLCPGASCAEPIHEGSKQTKAHLFVPTQFKATHSSLWRQLREPRGEVSPAFSPNLPTLLLDCFWDNATLPCQKIGAVGLNSPVMGAPWSGLASLPGPRLSHPDSPVV